MSTKIQINSLQALERLIGNDNELEIQIRNSVVQDFAKKHLKSVATSDVVASIGKAVKEEIQSNFFEVVKSNWGSTVKTSFRADVIASLKEELDREVRKQLTSMIENAINEQGTIDFINKKLKESSEHIEYHLTQSVMNGKLDKMVDSRIKERLAIK